MSEALAYNLFDDEYSDAQESPPPRIRARKYQINNEAERPTEALDSPARGHVFPRVDMRGRGYQVMLRRPIALSVENDNGLYLVSHEESRIYGAGETPAEALRDFDSAFVAVYLSYVRSEDPLSAGAEEYARYLDQLVESFEEI